MAALRCIIDSMIFDAIAAEPEVLALVDRLTSARRLDELRARPGVGDEDAQIAATAAAQGVPLVTEDRDLRDAVGLLLPQLALWSWAADLRPRITALGAAA
jgi:predicted nucleic acid-binding protein